MGQEVSGPKHESNHPKTLEGRSLAAIAKYIREGRAKRIVVMTGAGISTSAGIPDFRSPNTGIYSNLAKLQLPYPEAVFDISFFRGNPLPFYTLAHEIYPGKYRPTISHTFIRLLSDKGLLLKLFTQNIDCLEREAGVPEEKIVEAHGSFASQSCIECKAAYPEDLMKEAINNRDVPHCLTPQCNGPVKPDIVFFGEQLPEKFHKNKTLPTTADLCIIMGTSLTVQPFASLPGFCLEGVPRLLINSVRVGSLGSRPDDVLLLGDCDDGVRKLASALGLKEELETLWDRTNPMKQGIAQPILQKKTKDEALEDRIAVLTEDVNRTLKISNYHTAFLRNHLLEKASKVLQSESATGSIANETKIAHRMDRAKLGTEVTNSPLPEVVAIVDSKTTHENPACNNKDNLSLL